MVMFLSATLLTRWIPALPTITPFTSSGIDQTQTYTRLIPAQPAPDATNLTFLPLFEVGDEFQIVLDNPLPPTGGVVNAIIGEHRETDIPATDSLCVDGCFLTGQVVPIPAALWLFGSGLLGLIGIARKKAA